MANEQATQAMINHVNHTLSTKRSINQGQGYHWDQGSIQTRLGRTEEGYYVLASWRTMETYDGDPESRTCRCKNCGRPHNGIHRVAASIADLLTAHNERGCY